MSKPIQIGVSIWALAVLAPAYAADPAPPPKNTTPYFAANCANCHGTDGKSTNTAIPSLSGRDRGYLEQTLKAYKEGTKSGTIMPQLAKGYTDGEISALAEFFSKQK